MAVVVGVAMVTTTAVGEVMVVGGHQRSPVGSSPVHWLLRIMPLPILLRTMRRPMHRHRSMGRGGGVTPRNLITPTHKLAPAGSEPFSHGETETETRVTRVPQSWAFGSVGASAHPRPDSPAEEGFRTARSPSGREHLSPHDFCRTECWKKAVRKKRPS
jgi:hypothetical protein